ncbi:protein of unknown function [Roseateles sp. YR242]|uniref:DUF4280 domain-containing protein n=1 Tax=Roseateles sp. YR242 TaxID=1855305 RepID=UPI0008B8D32A|nr:DUF4280 domain-containing protein [Roseateles sp. YR242]SEK22608.1 protein of unknown function [Roseateles sp. YR242]
MPLHVCTGATLACTFGAAPSVFNATPRPVLVQQRPLGVVMDHVPLLNILPFGVCTAPANPMVIAATAAALGAPTPAPCLPATPAPWLPGVPSVLVGQLPALDELCSLTCQWGGVIRVVFAGQVIQQIP